MTHPIRRVLFPLAVTGLALAACDDPTEIEPHADVEGLAIVASSGELYRYMLEDGAPPALSLAVGTYEVAIVLLDHDGEPLPHEEDEDEEEELLVTIGDPSVLTWTPEAETPGTVHTELEFHGELDALQAGSTTMEICLPHAGHCDFDADIPVTVTP